MKTNPDLRLAVTLRLLDDEGQRRFGPGVAALLSRVREERSLRAAAGSMGMAYSKAWRIVRSAEAAFGCKLLRSTIGGKNGGGAVLTGEAEALLDAYQALRAEVEAYAQARFRERFGPR
ncbi:winged helix-turn-helix domain-containing protein [uncultured Oscillibacter sp.]|uniref:winged helix-turn-helix domain-containing protein n=1 Tax=uncultured Oscillibacter sp. TaxID=876091 RepID=UPI0025EE028D|nr:LysR family transcriptional regulator [uncultured Oscillibacter sp.]